MCGIAGCAGSRKFVEPDESVVLRMAETIRHRGPDEGGQFVIAANGWGVNLAMRRLAIIDREGGSQPVHAGGVSLVFNGEIYNHSKLRHDMKSCGTSFRTVCDTEVVARLWDARQLSCLNDLDGMFAFALWDRRKRELYLVRDRLGKKPLYYYWDQSRNLLVFGSEIKALLAHPHVPRELNHEGICHYLSLQYVPEPMTAYKGILCVPPGGIVVYRPAEGKLDVQWWWKLGPNPVDQLTEDQDECVNAVRQTVQEAILSRLESEVPLGVYLSGGIDSSIIAGVASQACGNIHTFSMGFAEDSYNELPFARQTAQLFGTIHHESLVQIPDFPAMADRIVAQYDQPFGDCSAIPTMILARESKRYITVALTGDGGDEAFGGYERYWACDPKTEIVGYLPWVCVIPFGLRDQLLDAGFKQSVSSSTRAWMLREAFSYPGQDPMNQRLWLDTKTYLPNDIIVKMERASMAASVEARCPFLDHRVMELAFSIPSRFKVGVGVGKLVLREAFKDVLTPEILARPKRGFGVPVNEWFRSEVGCRMLTDMVTDVDWPWGILDGGRVAGLIETHLSGQMNCGHAIWVIYMLHLWMKMNFSQEK